MDGFKNSTKMQTGHSFGASKTACPDYASGSRNVFATGGIVAPFKQPGRVGMSAPRPVMPRPRVMPQMKMQGMPGGLKMAKGGSVGDNHHGDGAGGPYNGHPEGSSLEKSNRPYSEIEVEHPRNDARPGYARGGKKGGIHIKPSYKGLFTKKMTGSKSGKLTGADVSKGLHSSSGSTRKQANFARMARRHFQPLHEGGRAVGFAKGGPVCDTDAMEGIANTAVASHVRAKPPQGHGVKPKGNLAFMSKPLFGKG